MSRMHMIRWHEIIAKHMDDKQGICNWYGCLIKINKIEFCKMITVKTGNMSCNQKTASIGYHPIT